MDQVDLLIMNPPFTSWENMAGEYRKTILDDLFGRMADHVEPERVAEVDAVLHFKIYDRPGGGYDQELHRLPSFAAAAETALHGRDGWPAVTRAHSAH